MKKVTLEHKVTLEVKPMKFTPSPMLAFYDMGKLSKGKHKIEVGHYEGGCCSNAVFVSIKDGMILNIETATCKDQKKNKISPAVQKIFTAAVAEYKKNTRPINFPVSVKENLTAAMLRIIVTDNCIGISGDWPFKWFYACCIIDKQVVCFDVHTTISTDPL